MRKFLILLSIAFFIFLDLGSKVFVEDYLFGSWKEICTYPDLNVAATPEYCYQDTIKLSEYFSLQLSYNRGVAFSMPIHGLPLQFLTLILIIGLITYYLGVEYKRDSRLIDTAYIFILAGALSHAYERIFVGHVVDFISVKYFAIFNLADILISVGVFLIIFAQVYYGRKSR